MCLGLALNDSMLNACCKSCNNLVRLQSSGLKLIFYMM